jgi:hypothetical protein
MATTKEALMHIFFGGTELNGLETFGTKKYRDMSEPGGYARVLKRPVILALSATKIVESFASVAFVIKAGALTVGPSLYRYMGADLGMASVDSIEAPLTALLATQNILATAGAHYLQTILQRK